MRRTGRVRGHQCLHAADLLGTPYPRQNAIKRQDQGIKPAVFMKVGQDLFVQSALGRKLAGRSFRP